MAQNEITVCLRCDVTPDALKASEVCNYLATPTHPHKHIYAHGKSFICRRKPTFGEGKEQSIIFEGFRNCFVLRVPSQSPCISLGHNLNYTSVDPGINRSVLAFRY